MPQPACDSEAAFESAAFKRTPLPSELQNLSALCCILGITSFLSPPGQSQPWSSTPSGTSPTLEAHPSGFGLPAPSLGGPAPSTTSTGSSNPLLALADPPDLADLLPGVVPYAQPACNSVCCV